MLLVAALLAATPVWAAPKVYLRANTSLNEHADAQKLKELNDSVRDLREQLEKRHDVVLTTERGDAVILVTVLDRRLEVNRAGVNDYGGALRQQHYQSRYILAYRIESGAQADEGEAALAGAFVTWKRVAGEVAKDIGDWARRLEEAER